MKLPKNYLAFFLIVLALLSMFNCKGKGSSAIKAANDFVEAGMNGEYEKLAELCCKYDGPYTTLEDIKYLDLGGFGFIKKILREEKYEIDPGNTKIVVARLDIEGRIVFRCFYVFKTPKSYKVYFDDDWLREYPPHKESLFNTALNFYFSNKINLKNAAKFAEHIVSTNPNYVKAHYILASIHILNNRKPNAIAEIKKVIDIDPDSRYISSFDKNYLIEIAEDLFKGESAKSRIQAIKLLNKIPPDDRKIPFIEKALQDEVNDIRLQALTLVDKLPDDRKIPYIEEALQDEVSDIRMKALALVDKLPVDKKIPLFDRALLDNDINLRLHVVNLLSKIRHARRIPVLEKALKDNSIKVKERAARILTSLGNDKGKAVLINILSTRLKLLLDKYRSNRNKWLILQDGKRIAQELGNLRDSRGVPIIIDVIMLGCGEGAERYAATEILKIGRPAIPALEAALARENEYRKIWSEMRLHRGQTEWRLRAIKSILNKLKNR